MVAIRGAPRIGVPSTGDIRIVRRFERIRQSKALVDIMWGTYFPEKYGKLDFRAPTALSNVGCTVG